MFEDVDGDLKTASVLSLLAIGGGAVAVGMGWLAVFVEPTSPTVFEVSVATVVFGIGLGMIWIETGSDKSA